MNLPSRFPPRSFRRAWLRCALAAAGLFSIVLAAPAFAQSNAGTIQGRVLSPATGEYLRNVEVTVAGTNLTTFTGDDGFFVLAGVPPGERELSVAYTGYDTATARLNVSAGATLHLDGRAPHLDYRGAHAMGS